MDWLSYSLPLMEGAWVTIQLTLYSTVVGAIAAFALGIGRLSHSVALRSLSITIIEVFRGTSLLVQLFWLYFALPILGQSMGLDWRLDPVVAGTLALGLNIGAYGAEVVRGAIQAVPHSQLEAAKALDFTERQTLWRISLPQAIPRIIPAMGNYLVSIMKDVPVLSVVSVLEVLNVAKIIGDRTFNYIIPLSMVGGLYLLLTLLASAGVRALDQRLPKQGIPLR